MTKFRKADPASVVTSVLQGYADRGVFRGFSSTRSSQGRHEYRFTWLTRRPMIVAFDPQTSVLTFKGLLPSARSAAGMVDDLQRLVASRSARDVPSNKRLDRRRAILAAATRQGDWSLAATVRGSNHEYATRLALNLVNEIFLLLHERHPDYLVQHFGFKNE